MPALRFLGESVDQVRLTSLAYNGVVIQENQVFAARLFRTAVAGRDESLSSPRCVDKRPPGIRGTASAVASVEQSSTTMTSKRSVP